MDARTFSLELDSAMDAVSRTSSKMQPAFCRPTVADEEDVRQSVRPRTYVNRGIGKQIQA